MNAKLSSADTAHLIVDRVLAVGTALHSAGAPAGQVEATVEALGQIRGLDVQCLAGPTSIQVVHEGRARLVRTGPAGIDLTLQARLSRAVSEEVRGAATDAPDVLDAPGPLPLSATSETALWCLLALTAAAGMNGSDGTVLAAGVLGLSVGALVSLARHFSGMAALVPLTGALLASAGAAALQWLWPLDPVTAPMAAILVLLPGWSLTVGVGEVATGHLASGSARLTGAFVTVLQLALGWVAGAETVDWLGLEHVQQPGLLDSRTLPGWLGMLGVSACFALLFRAERRHWIWVTAGVALAWSTAFLPLGVLAKGYLGALLIGLFGATLSRRTGLPGQLVTVPGVMLLVPGGALLAAVLRLVRHDPTGLAAAVDALGVAGVLVGGLLTARLLLPPRSPE